MTGSHKYRHAPTKQRPIASHSQLSFNLISDFEAQKRPLVSLFVLSIKLLHKQRYPA
jgi:hypothetical protein